MRHRIDRRRWTRRWSSVRGSTVAATLTLVGAAFVRVVGWTAGRLAGALDDVLGRASRGGASSATSGRAGWPDAEEVESALEDLRRHAA